MAHHEGEQPPIEKSLILGRWTRRQVVKGGAIGGAGLFIAGSMGFGYYEVLTKSDPPARKLPPPPPDVHAAPDINELTVLTESQAATLEAIAARIIPGDASDPGAREAGVVYYIDAVLTQDMGYVQPTYVQEPFPEVYEGPEPPSDDGSTLWVSEDEIDRYGYQQPLTPLDVYELGLDALDTEARARFGSVFVELTEDEQDELLMAIEDGEAEEFALVDASTFFETVRGHVIEGMFGDPVHGGNRDLVGWHLIGYPGSQRGYTPTEMKTEGTDREPQSLADMKPFSPGRPEQEDVILPVQGPIEYADEDADFGEEDRGPYNPEAE